VSRVAVIVPVRNAVGTIESTLAELAPQCRRAGAEIVVAVSRDDPTVDLLRRLAPSGIRLIVTADRRSVPGLRSEAVFSSQSEFVIITEDHCLFPDRWIDGLVEAASRDGVEVSGGGVENGRGGYSGWAQYFTRYASFMPPLPGGPTTALPGNNACYRRAVLEDRRDLIEEGFWEAEFNRVIADRRPFWLCGGLEVVQRQERGLWEYAPLRYRHGRCYGARRWRAAGGVERRNLMLRAPLIPLVLFARAARAVFSRRRSRARFVVCAPLLALYFLAWGAGEIAGYLAGAGGSCRDTD